MKKRDLKRFFDSLPQLEYLAYLPPVWAFRIGAESSEILDWTFTRRTTSNELHVARLDSMVPWVGVVSRRIGWEGSPPSTEPLFSKRRGKDGGLDRPWNG